MNEAQSTAYSTFNTTVDLGVSKKIKLKAYNSGYNTNDTYTIKLQLGNTNGYVEATATISEKEQWQVLEFDFSNEDTVTFYNIRVSWDFESWYDELYIDEIEYKL